MKNKFYLAVYELLTFLNIHFTISEIKFMDRLDYLEHVFYPKWVLGECHHLCRKCKYKYECFSNLESEE